MLYQKYLWQVSLVNHPFFLISKILIFSRGKKCAPPQEMAHEYPKAMLRILFLFAKYLLSQSSGQLG